MKSSKQPSKRLTILEGGVSSSFEAPWYVYLFQCWDCSIYTGIAKDVGRRMMEHNQGRGSKYIRSRGGGQVLAFHAFHNRRKAAYEERRIKRLPRQKKLELVKTWGGKLLWWCKNGRLCKHWKKMRTRPS